MEIPTTGRKPWCYTLPPVKAESKFKIEACPSLKKKKMNLTVSMQIDMGNETKAQVSTEHHRVGSVIHTAASKALKLDF